MKNKICKKILWIGVIGGLCYLFFNAYSSSRDAIIRYEDSLRAEGAANKYQEDVEIVSDCFGIWEKDNNFVWPYIRGFNQNCDYVEWGGPIIMEKDGTILHKLTQ